MTKPAYMQEDWFVNGLMREVRAVNVTQVAARMGVARKTLSIFVNGSGAYGTGKAKPDRIRARYHAAFGRVVCPFSRAEVDGEHCREYALQKAPIHNPFKLEHWRTCQTCPHRPVKGESK